MRSIHLAPRLVVFFDHTVIDTKAESLRCERYSVPGRFMNATLLGVGRQCWLSNCDLAAVIEHRNDRTIRSYS